MKLRKSTAKGLEPRLSRLLVQHSTAELLCYIKVWIGKGVTLTIHAPLTYLNLATHLGRMGSRPRRPGWPRGRYRHARTFHPASVGGLRCNQVVICEGEENDKCPDYIHPAWTNDIQYHSGDPWRWEKPGEKKKKIFIPLVFLMSQRNIQMIGHISTIWDCILSDGSRVRY